MNLRIQACTIADVESAPNIHELLKEYAVECSIKDLPEPFPKIDMYKQLESTGLLHTIGAFLNGTLIGYVTILTTVLPHYSEVVAVTESLFVAKAHRKTGAGLRLIKAAEGYAKRKKALGLLVSAPIGGSLVDVLPRAGFRATNLVFFRGFDA